MLFGLARLESHREKNSNGRLRKLAGPNIEPQYGGVFFASVEQVVLLIAATKRGEQVNSMRFVHVEQVLFGIAARGSWCGAKVESLADCRNIML